MRVGKNKNSHDAPDRKIIIGLEPAGGCTVLVAIIIIIAKEMAIATDHQVAPKFTKQINPTRELKKCPSTTFLG